MTIPEDRVSEALDERDTSERRHHIATMLRGLGSVQVASLSRRFSVSTQTIRKDLHYLAGRGVAVRTYGGAIAAETVSTGAETGVSHKQTIRIREKQAIGKAAAALVQSGDSIILDSGTTTLEIAKCLPRDRDITVVTNDYGILAALADRSDVEVVLLGGRLRRKSMAFYGSQTEDSMSGLAVDKLFLGVDGFDVERGVTTHFEAEASLNRRMADVAREIVAVTDSTKFGRVCLHRILGVGEIDLLITDVEAPEQFRNNDPDRTFDVIIAEG